jgi:acyl-[acyl-carrier-protein]-phospholipid O-acyltransferase/long-chain-fatty-acid--[acyl-carrier-protein] ligase
MVDSVVAERRGAIRDQRSASFDRQVARAVAQELPMEFVPFCPLTPLTPLTPLAATWLAALLWVLLGILLVPLVLALAALLLVLIGVFVIPRQMTKAIARCVYALFYRIHLHHPERVPSQGGAVLVANHISWLDGVLMMSMTTRLVRSMVYAGNFRSRIMQVAARRWEAIMVEPGPKAILRSLKAARQAALDGHVVGIFPEGGISRSGTMLGFRAGFVKIVEGTDVPVVPIYFDGLWGSIFSFEGRKFFWKIPRRWPFRIDIYFGEPLRHVTDVESVRRAVQKLGAEAVSERLQRKTDLPGAVIRACKRRRFEAKIADSTGAQLTGGQVLMRSLVLRRLLRRHVLSADENYVGLLLPPSTGAVLANLAVSFDRRVAINLNYTVSSDVMNQCIRLADIRHVLTSRKVMDKLDLKIDAELVYLEDLRPHVGLSDKLAGLLAAYVWPAAWVRAGLGLARHEPDDTLTVIFTSGSTGIPKGVMLTHANIRHNVDAVNQVIHLQHRDTLVGILPFFHSFGFTITLWAVMALDVKGAYHFSPLDARQVGKLIEQQRGTILLSTPTFLRSYLRRCTPAELASLDTIVVGAEKLPRELSDAFETKFGVRPVEGYGTTELSPLVSVNIPPSRTVPSHQPELREGTVGRTVPGVAAKVVDDQGHDLGTDQPGMLLISGANVMKGYINQPDKTAEVMRDGWYVTGDIAKIDDDGFITITGRESRFSKIGGEMVPHLRIEECLQQALGGDTEEEGELKVAVTSVPDEKKGERLIVLHTQLKQTPEQLTAALKAMGLPNIYIPSVDSYLQVDSIPVLGTGKLDLRGLKELAVERIRDDGEQT